MVTFVVAVVFGLGLLLFVITHWKFVLYNSGTIDSFENDGSRDSNFPNYSGDSSTQMLHYIRPRENGNPYDIGRRKNFEQIFGSNPWFWLLPVYSTPGDGIQWEVKTEQHSLLV